MNTIGTTGLKKIFTLIKNKIDNVSNNKLDYVLYPNRSGITSNYNDERTYSIIKEICDNHNWSQKTMIVRINNRANQDEILFLYDVGCPFVLGLKISFYYDPNSDSPIRIYRMGLNSDNTEINYYPVKILQMQSV